MGTKSRIAKSKPHLRPTRPEADRAKIHAIVPIVENFEPSNSNAAEQIYLELMAGTQSLRKQNNLRNVWDALEHLRHVKSQDFRVASVARAIRAIGRAGPKAQSIRNPEGQDFRHLIDGYILHFGLGGEANPPSLSEDLAASIPDLRVAAFVQSIQNENISLKRRLNLLKNLYSKLAPVDVGLKPEVARQAGGSRSSPASGAKFTAIEIAATARFLENVRDNGEDHQLEFDAGTGALLWRGGILELANAAFYHALQKIVRSSP